MNAKKVIKTRTRNQWLETFLEVTRGVLREEASVQQGIARHRGNTESGRGRDKEAKKRTSQKKEEKYEA